MSSAGPTGRPRYERVQEIADELVASGAERGLQVAAYVDGKQVVDVVAGVADPATGRPVTPDTLFYNWSIGKGATATLVHRLARSTRRDPRRRGVAGVRQARQGRRHRPAGARPHRGRAGAARGRHGRRRLLVADDGRRAGGRAAVVGAGHAGRLPRLHVRLPVRARSCGGSPGARWATSSPTSPPTSATPARSATAWRDATGLAVLGGRAVRRGLVADARGSRCCGPRR